MIGAMWVRSLFGTPGDVAATFSLILLLLQWGSEFRGRDRTELSAVADIRGIVINVCVAYTLASSIPILFHMTIPARSLGLAVAAVPLLFVGRALFYGLERWRRRRGHGLRTLIVGGGEVAEYLTTTLSSYPEYGLDVVGFVDDDPNPNQRQPSSLLGGVANMQEVVRSHQVEAVVVAYAGCRDSEVADLIRDILSSGTSVWVVPRFYEFGTTQKGLEDLSGMPVVKLLPPGPARVEWRLKRVVDVAGAGLGLLILSPLMALATALIVTTSGRPVFFRQRRVGANGNHFEILKLRTMTVCDDAVSDAEWAPSDVRTTTFGKFLRSSGLDEIPQLWNVLKGDMSLVGPRPERPVFVEEFSKFQPRYKSRLRVAAGITGWAQIHDRRRDSSVDHKITADNYYIDNWSLGMDMGILLRTVPSLLLPARVASAPPKVEDLLPIPEVGKPSLVPVERPPAEVEPTLIRAGIPGEQS